MNFIFKAVATALLIPSEGVDGFIHTFQGSIRGQGCPGRVESDFLNMGF